MTFSRPTAPAYCTMRSATSSGCSTKFDVESITPGMIALPSGSLTACPTLPPVQGRLPGRRLAVLPPLPLVAVARIGARERHRHGLGLEHDVDDVFERN